MADIIKKYISKATSVLNANWTGAYTLPASGLYPHQWNWDSGFIAIGYAHINTQRAIKELTSLFNGQWKNGMVPQIVFNKDKLGNYFPEPDFWQTENSPNAPEGILTSGITMPPIHAVAALRISENARDNKDVKPFLKWIYPRLLSLHRYFYRERDPEGQGLVYIRHPWESGMDNSPMWDLVLKRLDMSSLKVPPYERKDLASGVRPEERPAREDYDRFVYLVDLFRRLKYDEELISKESPFLVYGPLFNAILSASNEALIRIGEILKERTDEAEEWEGLTKKAISEKLYQPEGGIFNFYDIREKKLLDVDSAAGFMPLFGGAATKEQALKLYDYLNSQSFCALHQGNCFTVPNYDTRKEDYDRTNYWRGPVWININWMLMQGLRRYGFKQKADAIAKDILELPVRFGFREYFDSFDGRGYGAHNFSWSAALFIDTAYDNYLDVGTQAPGKRIKKILWRDIILNESGGKSEMPLGIISQNMLAAIREINSNYCSKCGSVDYGAIRHSKEYEEYRRITAKLKELDLAAVKEEHQKLAFWINIYNTIVIDRIICVGIRRSVKEVTGFFSKIKYDIGGYRFSANDIEHGILRANSRPPLGGLKQFKPMDPRRQFVLQRIDPRIHFTLVCGSRSCAPINFYTETGIYDELEVAATNFINSSEVIIIPEEKRVIISLIFSWYKKDFGGIEGVLAFIEKYIVDDDKRELLKKNKDKIHLDYLYYNWNLNE
ncbi:MAG: DUF547 domain-containing protein [Proteobacteria bacterium]|nr:DUF547 domain-containing protein [Pseudomonadota bacterium]